MKSDKSRKSRMDYFKEFVIYKQSIGYVYDTQSYYLKQYLQYEDTHFKKDILSKESIDGYLDSIKDSQGSLYGTVCSLREFARYLLNRGVPAYIIPSKTVFSETPKPPYFFTEDEINRFFIEADSVEPLPFYPGREIIIPVLFRLLCCCGIRCKEIRFLLRKDVFLNEKCFDIIKSKGNKDRRIYITDELNDYLKCYDESIAKLFPDREYFFPGLRGKHHLSKSFICGNFNALWRKAFPNMPSDTQPRAYDFRHHLAWANINKWASEGIDVNVMLPYLMRYMGHATVKQTLYYFHFVPEFYEIYREMTEDLESLLPEVQ